jgi:hypothetical protein
MTSFRLPWWRVVLLLAIAVAVAFWLRQRARSVPDPAPPGPVTMVVAPLAPGAADGARFELRLGEARWRLPWADAAAAPDPAQMDLVDRLLEDVARAVGEAREGAVDGERGEILVDADTLGAVPPGLVLRLVDVYRAAGITDVQFLGKR